MNDGPAAAAIERFRLAQDRRADEREDLRNEFKRVAKDGTLRDYIDLHSATQTAPLPTSANVGFGHMKRRR